MKIKRRLLTALAICLATGLAGGRYALAASQTPSGITISPAFQQVSVPANSAQQPIHFSITNDKSTPQSLSLSVADFNTLGESGGLFFVGTNPTQLQQKYGLAKWVSLPDKQITIPPKKTVQVDAEILNLPTLASGGHYGALMLSLQNGSPTASSNQISVQPIASSLLFVTKLGGETYKLKLANVYASHSFLSLPSNITLRFQDFGNTHLIPRGLVTINDPDGKLVSKGIINQDSDIILPQTYRRYNVPLSKVSEAKLPGRYKLTVNYRFDGYAQYRTYETSFDVITPGMFLALLVALAAIFGVLYMGFRKFYQAGARNRARNARQP